VPEEVNHQKDKINGGLRLLMCDRTSLFPPGFGMPKAAFIEAEQVLKLHKATLPSFLVANGTHSRYVTRDEKGQLLKTGAYYHRCIASLADNDRSGPQSPSKIRDRELRPVCIFRCQDGIL
jgi:hypothetical protein